jgi:hypothetical protein
MRPPAPKPLPSFDPIPQAVVEAAKRIFLVFKAKTEAELLEMDFSADFIV